MAEKGKIAAKDHWQTIRSIATKDDSVHDISVAADGLSVTHGIYRTTRLASTSAIKSITHNFHSGQYLILYEGGSLEVFLKDGSPEKVKPRERIEGIIYASKAKIYVAWDNEGSIKVSQLSVVIFRLYCCLKQLLLPSGESQWGIIVVKPL